MGRHKNKKIPQKLEDKLLETPRSEYKKKFPEYSIWFLSKEKTRIRKERGIKDKHSKFKNPKLTKEEENFLLENPIKVAKKHFPNHSKNFLKEEKTRIRKERGITKIANTSSNPPLTKEQQDFLLITKYNEDLKNLFPDHTIEFLKKEKSKIREERGLDRFNRPIDTTPEQDLLLKDKNEKIKSYTKKNKELLKELAQLKKENDAFNIISKNAYSSKPIQINPHDNKKTECAVVLQLSDWHWEEKVAPSMVNGLNKFDLDTANARVNQYCNDSLNIINTIKNPYNVRKLIIALQGDFISGNIHEELMENNMLEPSFAIIEAQKKIISLIEFYLKHTDFEEIVIVPSSGNHGRMSKKQKISTELGNSLEHYMYYVLENYFEENERIKFIPQKGYHTYVKVYDTMIRFHHGHFMRFWGAIGGITGTVNKSVGQWNKSMRADLDVFGHFHQTTRMKNFICNGSLIGYNAYAVSIKAEYESASQNLFVIDSTRGQTLFTPIILD